MIGRQRVIWILQAGQFWITHPTKNEELGRRWSDCKVFLYAPYNSLAIFVLNRSTPLLTLQKGLVFVICQSPIGNEEGRSVKAAHRQDCDMRWTSRQQSPAPNCKREYERGPSGGRGRHLQIKFGLAPNFPVSPLNSINANQTPHEYLVLTQLPTIPVKWIPSPKLHLDYVLTNVGYRT